MGFHETVAPLPSDVPVTTDRRVRQSKNHDSDWQLLRCTMCQGAGAFQASDGHRLLHHLVTKHSGQALPEDTVVQLRVLGREACGDCGKIRAFWVPRCNSCRCVTTTRTLRSGDVVVPSGDVVVPPIRRTIGKPVCKKHDEMHECKKCRRGFSCKNRLRRHVIKKHNLFKKHMAVFDSEQNDMHECKKCGQVFSCKGRLRRHLIKKHMEVIDSKKKAVISAKKDTDEDPGLHGQVVAASETTSAALVPRDDKGYLLDTAHTQVASATSSAARISRVWKKGVLSRTEASPMAAKSDDSWDSI